MSSNAGVGGYVTARKDKWGPWTGRGTASMHPAPVLPPTSPPKVAVEKVSNNPSILEDFRDKAGDLGRVLVPNV